MPKFMCASSQNLRPMQVKVARMRHQDQIEAVSDVLRTAMRAKGITQKQIAIVVDKDQSAVSRWVNGKTLPAEEDWPKLEALFGLADNTIAVATGHIILPGQKSEIPPLVIKTASDIHQLPPADLKFVREMVRRLLKD